MRRPFIVVALLTLLFWFVGCGSSNPKSSNNMPPGTPAPNGTPGAPSPGPTPTPTPGSAPTEYVYTTNAGSFDLSGFKINQDGSLASVPGFPVTPPRIEAPFFSGALSLAAVGKFLLVPSSAPNAAAGIASYTIDPATGAVTLVPQPAGTADSFTAEGPFAIDATHMIVYMAGSWTQTVPTGEIGGTGIGFYKLNADGTLSALPGSPLHTTMIGPMALDAFANSLFVASAGRIEAIPLNADGSLGTPRPPQPLPGALSNASGSEPCIFEMQGSVAVHPSGKFLITACDGSDAINVFSVNAGGQLAVVQTLTPTSPSMEFTSLALNPAGTMAAATQEAQNTLAVFTVDQGTGALTQIATATAGTRPNSISFDGTGSFLYATNGSSVLSKNVSLPGSDNVSGYAVAGNGTLTPVPNSPVPTGTFPRSIVVTQP